MQVQTGHTQTLRAQFWIKPPRPNLLSRIMIRLKLKEPPMTIETLAEREKARGNTVIEMHKDCDCIGAGNNNNDDITTDRDDHLLVLDAEKVI